MSLKRFHIVFIGASALLALGSAAYALAELDGAIRLIAAAGCVACAGGFVVYGRSFLRRMSRMEADA